MKRGLQTSVTFGNAKAIDLLAFNEKTRRTFTIQVKTLCKKNFFPIAHAKVEPEHVYVFVLLNKLSRMEPRLTARLSERRLITRHPQGSITLLPALREILWEQLPVEARRSVHVYAAGIRAARAEYTAAADHLFQAGEPRAAL